MGQEEGNFDYYDPVTTGDSSLYACIESVVAAEVGHDDPEINDLRYALLNDVADVRGHVGSGVHSASIGGTWMAIVYGLAGMRDYDGELSFNPKSFVKKLRFVLNFRGQQLEVDVADGSVTYLLRQGEGLTIKHREEELRLAEGKPMARSLTGAPAAPQEPSRQSPAVAAAAS